MFELITSVQVFNAMRLRVMTLKLSYLLAATLEMTPKYFSSGH